ncbi:cation efflux system protein [Methylopila jiangsuensis]|uniref:Cation efflux system protein n=1 Tax=Methylopila jiangsuensis TaxID=586230 RepID=A0A9W6JET0_9HYPH|nr:efflux RND transporter periplasmic adaptor subunit [Methylopila jiangsuensis]MDR6287377.1 Cu(I)/Ag(I) efflux system membrane fusion protein [Methylopila jiangsuensis]GLK74958.1 cation efflux system protein [Methylopila jiangsuensis]
MKAAASVGVILLAAALVGGGYWAGQRGVPPGATAVPTKGRPAPTAAASPILYYRDPDGRPVYSASPRATGDGKPFVAVREGEDVGFDPSTGEPVAARSAAAPAVSSNPSGDRILYYRNPMGLPDTSPVPKKDSMGMDYIPVREGEDEGGAVTVSQGKRQRSGVRTERLGRRTLSAPLRASGSIQLDERRVSVVSVRSQSFVQKVEAVTTGEAVRKGQVLMQVYSPEVAAAAAQFLSVVGQPSGAGRAVVDGARRRLENLDVPAAVIDAIATSGKVPATIGWPAPRDGLILLRNAIEGMQAMPGDEMFRLADVSVVWALLDVAERDLSMVAVGQPVTVRPRGADRGITGRVALIYPSVNRETRTARVRVELPNPDRLLLPDMYVEAEIAIGAGGPVLAAPDSAILDSGDRQVALVETGEGRFEPRPVKLGLRSEGFVEIRAGLTEGETVVVGANFLIDAESNLKAALSGLTPPDPSTSTETRK